MPLWRIFAHPSTFSPEQKKGISEAITGLYTRALPRFYVVVLFVDLNEDQIYVGGEPHKNFVRIVVEQIARTMPDVATEKGMKFRKRWMDRINAALKPFIIDRSEIDWEIHITETPRDLWCIQGIDPPPPDSDAEKMWKERDRPLAYEKL